MYLITRESIVRQVPERWAKQYPESIEGRTAFATIYKKLLAAVPLTEEVADRIIGNTSWTSLICDECGQEVSAVMVVGQEPDYESATASLCLDCLQKALAEIQKAPVVLVQKGKRK